MNTHLTILFQTVITFYFLSFTGICQQTNNIRESQLTKHPASDRCASYSPDGKKILFESDRNGNWDIFLMDADGKNQTQLTSDTTDERRPAWHPLGKGIIFESNASSLKEMDISTKTTQTLIDSSRVGGEISFAQYAPDGERIAFTVKKSNSSLNLAIYTPQNDSLQWLTTGNFRSVFPNWSPNGKEILCFSRRETNNFDDEIYRIDLASGKWTRLTDWPKHNFCPSWSRDGKRIAYVTSMEDSRPEIYTMKKNGKRQTRITFNEDGETLPRWSLDGKKLLMTAYRNGNYEICEIFLNSIK